MEGPVSLCWYFFGILNLLSLWSPLPMCHTVCSPNRRIDMVKMLLAPNSGYSTHSRKFSREFFFYQLMIMVCFTETAPIGLSGKITQTKMRERVWWEVKVKYNSHKNNIYLCNKKSNVYFVVTWSTQGKYMMKHWSKVDKTNMDYIMKYEGSLLNDQCSDIKRFSSR